MGHERKNGIVGTRGGRGCARRIHATGRSYDAQGVCRGKVCPAFRPGLEVEFDPEEAEQCGAFMEDALSEEEAADASQDVISC